MIAFLCWVRFGLNAKMQGTVEAFFLAISGGDYSCSRTAFNRLLATNVINDSITGYGGAAAVLARLEGAVVGFSSNFRFRMGCD